MKKSSTPTGCSEWAEKLAARHRDDLSSSETTGLHQHLQSCSACAAAYTAYAVMEASIRALPPAEPLHILPSQLLQQEAALAEDNHLDALASSQDKVALPFLLKERANAPSTARHSRALSFINMATAVLIVGVIMIGSVLLFANHHTTTTIAGRTSQTLVLTTPYHCDFYSDPGINQVCQDRLVRAAHLSKTIRGYRLTIDAAYADANRVLIVSHAIRIADGSYISMHWIGSSAHPISPLTTQQGVVLPDRGGEGWLSNARNSGGQVNFFDASGISESTRELSLHLDIASFIVEGIPTANRPIPVQGPVTFDFAVPFHPGRVANLHQTVTSGGKSITLEKVAVSLSETRLYLQGGSTDNGGYTLSIDGWSSGDFVLGGYDFRNHSTTVFFDYPLFDRQGTWTFRIAGKDGPWIFHFVVLPADSAGE
jgi:hypothetical protein